MSSQISERLILMSQESPDKRLQNLFFELKGILTSLIGWAEIFGNNLHEQRIPSSELLDFQQELTRIGQEFLHVRDSAIEEGTYFFGTEEDVLRWRKRLLIPAKELMGLATKIGSSESEMGNALPDGIELAEIVTGIANRMWMLIDALTNPDFQPQLPVEKPE